MPAGDLTIVSNAKSWAGASGLQTTPDTDAFVLRLISAASRFIANYLSRELFVLGGQGYSCVASIGADAGGAFLLLKSGLGVMLEYPLGIAPDMGAPVTDLLNATMASIVASADPSGHPSATNKIYVSSTADFNAGDPINVSLYPTINESHTGIGGSGMPLNEWPIYPANTLGSLSVGGVAISAASNGASGYTLGGRDGLPVMIGYSQGFARGVGIAAVYRAGYAMVPSDLEQVCIELVGLKIKERERIGQSGKSIGPEHISYITSDMTNSLRTMLKNYRRSVPRWA